LPDCLKYLPSAANAARDREDIMKARQTIVMCGVAVLALATATVQTAPGTGFSRIVAFGASLSDPGNAFVLRGGTNTPPDYDIDPLLVPSAPYARGGHHFSNGATWIEQYARAAGLAGSVRPAFGGPGEGTNYAVAAARGCDDGANVNLEAQVDAFLRDVDGDAPPDALYTIEIGGNDIRDALIAFPNGHGPLLQCAIQSIADNIGRLYVAGARTMLVWRAPDLGLTPAIRTLDRFNPGARNLAAGLSGAFNTGLDGAIVQLSMLPGIRIVRLDAFRLLNDLVANGEAFGLANVTMACVTPDVPPFTCQKPDQYLFWDGIHPTKAVHGIIAQEAAAVLMR
jgi:phospholipase/lecithinase/hemolysin